MVREIIFAGRKPGCSQHAPSKSSGRWEGGCKGPPSDSSVYWRARQHPSRVPESQQTDSRDVLITLPVNNVASQHFSRPSHSPCNLRRPCRGTAAQHYHLSFYGQVEELGQRGHHRIPVCLGDATPATWAWSPPCCLSDIYFAPVQWVGNYSQQPWSEYIWTWGGTGKGRTTKYHRGKLPSHFICGLMHAPCLICPFKSTIPILFGCYNQSVVHITHS